MNLFGIFRVVGNLVARALGVVGVVTDKHVDFALTYIAEARSLFMHDGVLNKPAAREYVVNALKAKFGIPEALARYVVELAYNFYKSGR